MNFTGTTAKKKQWKAEDCSANTKSMMIMRHKADKTHDAMEEDKDSSPRSSISRSPAKTAKRMQPIPDERPTFEVQRLSLNTISPVLLLEEMSDT